MIRPKDIPFLNGGELSIIYPSWKIRVRPLCISYPAGSYYGVNKSIEIDLSEYQVDVPGSERWVLIYFDNNDRQIKIFGDIQNYFITPFGPIDYRSITEFRNRQIFVLGDVKLQYGLECLKSDCISYERRCSDMLSSSSIFVSSEDHGGNWISEYVQGWNDGTTIYGRNLRIHRTNSYTLPGFPSNSPRIPIDMAPIIYEVNILSFATVPADIITFLDNPNWDIDTVFYIDGAANYVNCGAYKVLAVASTGTTYHVQKLMAPAMAADATPGGRAFLGDSQTMGQIYARTTGEKGILVSPRSSNSLRSYGTSKENHLYHAIKTTNKRFAMLDLTRCKTGDTPNCTAPDTSVCVSNIDWSVFAVQEITTPVICDISCQISCELSCQSNCESVCECAREANLLVDHCHYLDYGPPIVLKCEGVAQTPFEDGRTCFSCEFSCDAITGCHVLPSCPTECDSGDICDQCMTCEGGCQNPCQLGCETSAQCPNDCPNCHGDDGALFGPGDASGTREVIITNDLFCSFIPSGAPQSDGSLSSEQIKSFVTAVNGHQGLPVDGTLSYNVRLGLPAGSLETILINGWGSVLKGVSHLVFPAEYEIMIAGLKSVPNFSIAAESQNYVQQVSPREQVNSTSWKARFKINPNLSRDDLVKVIQDRYRFVTITNVKMLLQAETYSPGNKLNVRIPSFSRIIINGGGGEGVILDITDKYVRVDENQVFTCGDDGTWKSVCGRSCGNCGNSEISTCIFNDACGTIMTMCGTLQTCGLGADTSTTPPVSSGCYITYGLTDSGDPTFNTKISMTLHNVPAGITYYEWIENGGDGSLRYNWGSQKNGSNLTSAVLLVSKGTKVNIWCLMSGSNSSVAKIIIQT